MKAQPTHRLREAEVQQADTGECRCRYTGKRAGVLQQADGEEGTGLALHCAACGGYVEDSWLFTDGVPVTYEVSTEPIGDGEWLTMFHVEPHPSVAEAAAGLGWVTDVQLVREGDDDAKRALLDNPGWRLLHVTGGLHGPVEYVFGWPAPSHEPPVRVETGEHVHEWGDWLRVATDNHGSADYVRQCLGATCQAIEETSVRGWT